MTPAKPSPMPVVELIYPQERFGIIMLPPHRGARPLTAELIIEAVRALATIAPGRELEAAKILATDIAEMRELIRLLAEGVEHFKDYCESGGNPHGLDDETCSCSGCWALKKHQEWEAKLAALDVK